MFFAPNIYSTDPSVLCVVRLINFTFSIVFFTYNQLYSLWLGKNWLYDVRFPRGSTNACFTLFARALCGGAAPRVLS